MKKIVITQIFALLFIGAYAQGIYNDGAYIVHSVSGGSCWVLDNGSFTLTSNSSTTPTQFENLLITDDASLILGSASSPAYLTVTDGLAATSPASITIPSGSTGSSSLIVGTVSGTGSFTVNRYITGASLDWHLISSPVDAQMISGDFTPGSATYDFYLYNEPTNKWINRKNLDGGGGIAPYFDVVNGDLLFTPGRGYLAAYNESNPTKSFSGTINQDAISQPLTIDGTTDYQGANLMGNPYPSSIDWKASSGWTRTMLRNDAQTGTGYSMYIWNETANNYGAFVSNGNDESGTHNVTRYIPPMQGFFVMAASTGTFQMTEEVCVHESVSSWLKNTNISPDIIRLKVSSMGYGYDEVVIEDNETSKGGAQKWFSFVETAPSLWIGQEDKLYSILMDDIIQEENHYPIGFKAGIEEQYSIHATFDESSYMELILEDKKLNDYYKLLESQSYHFYSSPEDDPNRFVLHFSAVGLDEEYETSNPVNVFLSDNTINIINNHNLTGMVRVINLLGQEIISFDLKGDNTQTQTINAPAGYYIVNVVTKNGVVNKKVYLK
jgi:hypothetical protein